MPLNSSLSLTHKQRSWRLLDCLRLIRLGAELRYHTHTHSHIHRHTHTQSQTFTLTHTITDSHTHGDSLLSNCDSELWVRATSTTCDTCSSLIDHDARSKVGGSQVIVMKTVSWTELPPPLSACSQDCVFTCTHVAWLVTDRVLSTIQVPGFIFWYTSSSTQFPLLEVFPCLGYVSQTSFPSLATFHAID